jgi:3',5'-cyclic AMP phosphodiesterase CpdA
MAGHALTLLFFAPALALLAACGGAPPTPVVPSPTPPGAVRYFVGGDSRDDSAHVVPWAFRGAKVREARAFIFLGDMELSPELDTHFAKELTLLDPISFYPVIGNHEALLFGRFAVSTNALERDFRKSFLDQKRTPVQSRYEDKVVYSVDLDGGVHFVALDNVSQKGFGEGQLRWVEDDLAQASKRPGTRHVIVGMHKALAGNGVTTHSMEEDGPAAVADSNAMLAVLVKSHVSLILASHEHQYSHFVQGGIESYLTGGLGAPLKTASGPEHAFHHLLQLDVTDRGIQVTVVRFDGAPSTTVTEEVE